MMTKPAPRVEILLAVYNNAPHLRALLQSLLEQTYDDFHLIVSDDASTDDSLAIVDEMVPAFRNPVEVIRRPKGSGSARANFAFLTQQAAVRGQADIICWCDADDVWKPEKTALLVQAVQAREAVLGRDVPLYVQSDVHVVDANLGMIDSSFASFKKINPAEAHLLPRALISPHGLGCAAAFNAALLKRLTDIPVDEVTGHDWYATLVALCFGAVHHIPDKTVLYRQHGGNSSGQKRVGLFSYPASKLRMMYEVRRRVEIRRRQAQAVITVFGDQLPPEALRLITRFVATRGQNAIARRWVLWRERLLYPDRLRNTALMLFA
jgi:hypothetical protein